MKYFRSNDNGKSWTLSQIKIVPDKNGKIPSMHMNEHGITLQKGKYNGRLIRPSRYYNAKNSSERKSLYKSKKCGRANTPMLFTVMIEDTLGT